MSPSVPLGTVVEIKGGGTPSRGDPRYWSGSIPWATVKDFSSTTLSSTEESITAEGARESATNIIPAGAVIVPTRMAVGKAAVNTIDLAINQDLKALLPTREVDPRFLLHFMLSQADFLEGRAQGATVKGIKLDLLRNLPFPRLLLEQQRRIAAILDKADAVRRKHEQTLALADNLLKAAFLDMFGDPNTDGGRYSTSPVRQFGRVVTGNTPPREDARNYGDFIEWIKSDNINTPDHYITEAAERLSEAGMKRARTVPARATLVTCIAGSPDCIGNAALTDREVAFNQQINAVVPFEHTDPYFLYAQVIVAKPLIQRASTNSMKGMISKGRFEEIEFLNPPSDLQRAFGKWFGKFLDLVARAKRAHRESETQMASLSQRAFRGKL